MVYQNSFSKRECYLVNFGNSEIGEEQEMFKKSKKRMFLGCVAGVVMMSLVAMTALNAGAANIWSENFEDGDDVGWREHTNTANDVSTSFTATAGSGVGGSYGYERTGGTAFDHAEGIYIPTSSPGLLVNGDIHELSAEVQLGYAATNSRTGLTWGYDQHGWPVNHYWVVIQGSDHIEIQKGQIQAGSSTLSSGPSVGTDFTQFNTLSATFERVGSDVLITAFLNGVEQTSFLDTSSPLGLGTYYAGVTTGYFSVIDPDFPQVTANVVFDNITLDVVPEPCTLVLLGVGAVLSALKRRRG